jgi:hypothetical protein
LLAVSWAKANEAPKARITPSHNPFLFTFMYSPLCFLTSID